MGWLMKGKRRPCVCLAENFVRAGIFPLAVIISFERRVSLVGKGITYGASSEISLRWPELSLVDTEKTGADATVPTKVDPQSVPRTRNRSRRISIVRLILQ